MANPLDFVTEDDSKELSPFEAAKMRGISIRPTNGADVVSAGNDPLSRAIAPQPEQQPWTMEDLMKGLSALKEYVATGEFSPGTKVGNRLFGTGGEERYQTWPEKMVRSGVGAAGNALSSLEPVTSEQLIAPAMDMAGMAGGSALIERPGAATLGSGPVRPAGMKENLTPAIKWEGRVYKGKIGDEHVDIIPAGLQKYLDKQGLDLETAAAEDMLPDGYRSGFVDHQGRFLNHTQAAEYAATAPDLVHPDYRDYVKEYGPNKRGVLTSDMLLSDTQQPGAAISAAAQASKGPAPVFYSALEHAATNAAQDVMSPQQWLGYLKNQPGVKVEELTWTGIEDWLGAQKGKVRKEDVQRYLDEHKVEIKDVTKSGKPAGDTVSDELHDLATEAVIDAFHERSPHMVGQEHTTRYQNALERFSESPRGETAYNAVLESGFGREGQAPKYSNYQLPGGENYREHLLTMPPNAKGKNAALQAYHAANRDRVARGVREPDATERAAWKEIERFNDPEYRSSHWDEPNVLAHVRTNDRTIDGKKALHIEEIQSDWHQQGRKQGYKETNLGKDWTAKQEGEGWNVYDKNGEHRYTLNKDEATTPQEAVKEAANQLRDDNRAGHSTVPDAPFKTSWPELALKRMIRKAAEEGYDRISWTPGEAQAARYDLSKQVRAVRYKENLDGTIDIDVQPKDGTAAFNLHRDVPLVKLPDYIGKDAAEKIQKQEKDATGYRELSGDGLKVGGEGMREFYDKMLPKMAEKIGKAHGVKVKQANVDGGFRIEKNKHNGYNVIADDGVMIRSFNNKPEADAFVRTTMQHPVHYFDIPQSFRDHAIGKGFPLYMSGVPFPLVPVDHDPFKKKERK